MNDLSHCIIVKITIIIFNVPEQNDFQTCDRHISCGAQKNLVVVDFSEEKMSCFVVGIIIQRLRYTCRNKLHDDESSSFDDDKKPQRMISRLSQQVQDQD